jgi:glycosyltransferase involved in cell wall biosynthesis
VTERRPRQDVCVVIPVYNEATVVADVVRGVRDLYPTVVCVDDASTDRSGAQVLLAGAALVRHPFNLGQGAALRTGLEFGLRHTAAKYFVTFDADGQHDVADVAAMLDLLDADAAQIVFGSRFLDDRTTLTRSKRLVLGAAVRYTRASTGLSLSDTHNGLRAFTRDVAEELDLTMNGMAHASELLAIVAAKKFGYDEVPVHIRYTDYSRGKGQPLLNSVNILFDMIFR